MRPRLFLAPLSVLVLSAALPSDSNAAAITGKATTPHVTADKKPRPTRTVSTIKNLKQLVPRTRAPWWSMPAYPAGCGILEGDVYCIGWRMGPAHPLASNWTSKTPVRVELPGKAVALAIGYGSMCAVISKSNENIWLRHGNDPADIYCWGEGFDSAQPGQMANRSYATTSKPVMLYSSHDIDAISAGYGYVCILEGDITLRCWGNVPNYRQQTLGLDLGADSSLRGVQARQDAVYVLYADSPTWLPF
jgi:hypothetical protein